MSQSRRYERVWSLPSPFSKWIEGELARRAEQALLRRLADTTVLPDGFVVVDGTRLVNLASNDYLGLSRHPALVEAAKKAAERWGTGATASRLVTGTRPIHEELEQRVAAYLGAEAALVFPSGFQANLGVLVGLTDRETLLLSDELNHASIVDGCRLSRAERQVYPHRDQETVGRLLAESRHPRRMVVTDSIFSTTGQVAPLAELSQVCRRDEALLVTDEAHAFGVYGPRGRGVAAAQGAEAPVRVATFSKAMGAGGGFVAGPAEVRELLVNRARSFVFTTGLSPAVAAAALAAVKIAEGEEGEERRGRLWENVRVLRTGLAALGWPLWGNSHIVSVHVGEAADALELSAGLRVRGIWALPFRPPTVPPGMSLLRLAATAAHGGEALERVLSAFEELRQTQRDIWERSRESWEACGRPGRERA